MRLAGAVLLIAGSTGMGLWMAAGLRECLHIMERLIWMLHYIESEIGYCKSELAVVFERASERMEEPFAEMLEQVAVRMQKREGDAFSCIWREEVRALQKKCPHAGKALLILQEFATEGYSDIRMQLTQIRLVRQNLEEERDRMKKELNDKGKIYLCVGVLSGLVVSIILI